LTINICWSPFSKLLLAIRFRRVEQAELAGVRRCYDIAIVDDDELIRGALHGLMKASGFPARSFASAEEFLNSGEQERTACLIADIRMPGMSGLELQSELKKDHHMVPIIFFTAQGDEKNADASFKGGSRGVSAKPFDDEVLLDSVRAALDS
jgi:FixJ family two-component response regulator